MEDEILIKIKNLEVEYWNIHRNIFAFSFNKKSINYNELQSRTIQMTVELRDLRDKLRSNLQKSNFDEQVKSSLVKYVQSLIFVNDSLYKLCHGKWLKSIGSNYSPKEERNDIEIYKKDFSDLRSTIDDLNKRFKNS